MQRRWSIAALFLLVGSASAQSTSTGLPALREELTAEIQTRINNEAKLRAELDPLLAMLRNAGLLRVKFSQVSVGPYHACAVKNDDTVACWGRNDMGQSTPSAGAFASVSVGTFFSCGLKRDGTVACWGANTVGQSTPPDGMFTQIAAGGGFTCGIKSDGTIACWGSNTNGQLLAPAGRFKQVAAGASHACALDFQNQVTCWGLNSDGQAAVPAGVGMYAIARIAAGNSHTCAATGDGYSRAVTCWGSVGGTYANYYDVIAGGSFTCGGSWNGQTWKCWSYQYSSPGNLVGFQYSQLDISDDYLCGVVADGAVTCFGFNNFSISNPSWHSYYGQSSPPPP